jgi:hypothetical protein
MFEKRHYEAIAQSVKNAFRYCETDNQRRGVERMRNELVGLFQRDNPSFNRLRFEEACRVQEPAPIDPVALDAFRESR